MRAGGIKFGAATILFVVAIAFILWQRQQIRGFTQESAVLRDDIRQAMTFQDSNEQLLNTLKAEAARSENERRELARLRAQVSTLRQTEQENARLKSERDRLIKQLAQNETKESETTSEQRFLAAKLNLGKSLGLALLLTADDNDGRIPAEMPRALVQMAEMLSDALSPKTEGVTAKQFELVYKGSLRDVKNPSDTILAKEREPFQLSDGRWAKTYVFADGSSRRLAADTREGLAAREQELSGRSNP